MCTWSNSICLSSEVAILSEDLDRCLLVGGVETAMVSESELLVADRRPDSIQTPNKRHTSNLLLVAQLDRMQ